jgi:hypothetical protein
MHEQFYKGGQWYIFLLMVGTYSYSYVYIVDERTLGSISTT